MFGSIKEFLKGVYNDIGDVYNSRTKHEYLKDLSFICYLFAADEIASALLKGSYFYLIISVCLLYLIRVNYRKLRRITKSIP